MAGGERGRSKQTKYGEKSMKKKEADKQAKN
jgi:hypothetical protein